MHVILKIDDIKIISKFLLICERKRTNIRQHKFKRLKTIFYLPGVNFKWKLK
jgi:hypothetical protein